MGKIFRQMLSVVLVLTMVFNLLPLNCFSLEAAAESIDQTNDTSTTELSSGADSSYERLATAQIVEEDVSKRGESYKEFTTTTPIRSISMPSSSTRKNLAAAIPMMKMAMSPPSRTCRARSRNTNTRPIMWICCRSFRITRPR